MNIAPSGQASLLSLIAGGERPQRESARNDMLHPIQGVEEDNSTCIRRTLRMPLGKTHLSIGRRQTGSEHMQAPSEHRLHMADTHL